MIKELLGGHGLSIIGHAKNIPTRQFFHWNFHKYSVKIIYLSFTECFWDFRNNALWDTHKHALCPLSHDSKNMTIKQTRSHSLKPLCLTHLNTQTNGCIPLKVIFACSRLANRLVNVLRHFTFKNTTIQPNPWCCYRSILHTEH